MRDTYCLFVRYGTNDFHHVPLHGDLVILGRSPRRTDVIISDHRASRTHSRLERKPGAGWVITDLQSANGTTLDHHPIRASHPTLWQPGQVVTIGSTTLTLVQMTVLWTPQVDWDAYNHGLEIVRLSLDNSEVMQSFYGDGRH